ncbi:MAG: hypothetical protein D8M58_01995 [Calditrichaeota bacterium]|nr:MAG: hypothetical protein DWQ03_05085 [Calditrichota bacterium]MBL1204140.1 hypothetical protein [Calditrichota bacterium]NOG43971.1 PorV/PorQ family protein [Calditrichota bacterium]
MIRNKKAIYILFTLLISANIIHAGAFKKYASEFMYLGADGRGAAMGSAFTAISGDVTSIYWNPAGLVESQGVQAQFMHSKRFINDIRQNYLSFSMPYTESSTIAASLYYLTVNDIPDSRDIYNEAIGKAEYDKLKRFNVGDYILTLAYAQKYHSNIDFGVNVKFIYSDLEIESATGIGFDAGVKYTLDNLKLGLVLRDFTSTLMAWSTGTKEFVTPSARFGAAYNFNITSLNLRVIPAVDLNILAENRDYSAQVNAGPFSVDVLAGMEISYDDLLALRFGMDDLQRVNAGIGIALPRVTVDYAFTEYESELGNIHRISFHLFLGNVFQN